MADPIPSAPSHDGLLLTVGTVTCAGGLYLTLAGLGLVLSPGKLNGPGWIGVFAGLAFLAGGVAVILRGWLGVDDRQSELPEHAPFWMKSAYTLAGLTAVAALASIGTWIAFGSGTRSFNMTGLIAGPASEGVGRFVFGIGAIIAWILVIAMARIGVKKLFGRNS